jgi:hypothetical protein
LFLIAAHRHSNDAVHALAISVLEAVTEDDNGLRFLDQHLAMANARGG